MRSAIVVLVVAAFALPACSGYRQQDADLILRNGAVYTLEADQPWATAIVVTGNTITAVLADDSDAEAYIGPHTRVIDLEGKLAVPGFIDTHVHFAGFAAQQHDIMLMNVDSDEGLLEELGRVAPLVGEGEWITGGDWSGAIQWMAGTGELTEEGPSARWEPDLFNF